MFPKLIANILFYVIFISYFLLISLQNKVQIYPQYILLAILLGIHITVQFIRTKQAINKLKIQNEKHETYVASVIHDLKNPIIGQIRILEMLIKKETDVNTSNILKQLLSSNKLMFEMVMSVLNTYKYAECKINYDFQQCNLVDLISDTCKELTKFTPEENDLFLKINTNTNIVYADKMHLKRVIANLLSNAIRYRKEDTPIFVEINSDAEAYRFSVTNSGYHIAPEIQDKLFGKYMNKYSRCNKVSTGLGLYLSRKIINDHKGKMLVSSTQDGVNTFGFTIPKE